MNTINHNGLKDGEQEVIALAVRNTFRRGSIEKLEWEVSIYKENDDNDSILQIVQLIEEGYTSGHKPTWLLSFERKE